MAIPDKDTILKLEYADIGAPYAVVAGKPSISTLGLEFAEFGSPVVAAEGGASPPTIAELYLMVIIT